jgi:transposase
MPNRKPYPTDVSDEEWALVAPYLALVRENAPQRVHDLHEVFDALRWIVRTGAPWRMLPHDFPPWEAVYQQTRRWLRAGVFEEMVHDLRVLLRLASGRAPEPTATILDSRTLRSTPESGHRAGYDGAKRKRVRRCTRPSRLPSGAARHLGHRAGSRAGGGAGASSLGGHRRERGAGVRGPRLHR